MSEQIPGKVEVLDSTSTNVKITLNGDNADISAGGNGQDGDIILKDSAGNQRIHVDGQTGNVSIKNSAGVEIIRLNGSTGDITLGGAGTDGDIVLKDGTGKNRIRLDAGGGNAWLGGNGADGDIVLFRADGDNKTSAQSTINMDGQQANIFAGGNKADGDLVLRDGTGKDRIRLDARGGNAWFGGNGADGDIVLFRADGDNKTSAQSTINMDGQQANIFAGGNKADGDLVLRDGTGKNRIRLDAGGGNAWLGGNGADGDLLLFANNGDNETAEQATIHLNGDSGDIILKNADAAEHFDVVEAVAAEPGTIMTLDENGKLKPSGTQYDKKVVGVVAGAGNYRPGIVMDSKGGNEKRIPVSVLGKVSCKAEAANAPIEVGDLLTTSKTTGHAMKATDQGKAFGSIIGKALSPLQEGTGFVDMLVALQ